MLFIFDWDGTLCDSLAKIVRCTQAAARDLGLPEPDADAVKDIIGLSLPIAIHKVFPQVSDPDLQAMMKRYAHYFTQDSEQSSRFYPGVRETLDHLLAGGHHVAIATGKSRRGLDRLLGEMALDEYFHASRCADETASKPDPLMLRELLQEFAMPAYQAVMVGDTEYDMEMAQRLGMPRIAVSYGAHHIDRLRPFEPAMCLDNFDELLAWPEHLVLDD